MKPRKIWQEKLGKGSLFTPLPCEVSDVILRVPDRQLKTILQIADRMAVKHKANIGCPKVLG